MEQTSRRWLAFGAGFGAGAVFMSVVLYAGVIWFAPLPNPPKPWNTEALRASFAAAAYSRANDAIVLKYSIENTTIWDYRLSPGSTFLLLHKGRLATSREYRLLKLVPIPAGGRAQCAIQVPKTYNTNSHVQGFVIFDAERRYEIIFPRPTAPRPGEPQA